MAIRIGEDGTIISSEGEIPQGQSPIIGEDGSIQLGDQQTLPSYRTPYGSRRPPSSPLEGNRAVQENISDTEAEEDRIIQESTQENPASRRDLQESGNDSSRSISTIEYELQVKKAELKRCIRPIPIIVCVLFIVIALIAGSAIPAIGSLVAAVPIVQDFIRRIEVSGEVAQLTQELDGVRKGA